LEREYKNLELLLTGTQRENERCMAELERYAFSACEDANLLDIRIIFFVGED
jgi:hypothetical protein